MYARTAATCAGFGPSGSRETATVARAEAQQKARRVGRTVQAIWYLEAWGLRASVLHGEPAMKTTARCVLAAGLSLVAASGAEAQPVAQKGPRGDEVSALPAVGDPTTVFVFARTDCPITNRYAPELRRLVDRFAAQGVRFWLVYPDPGETEIEVQRHAR